MTGRGGIRRKQLLDDLQESSRYWNLKSKAVPHTQRMQGIEIIWPQKQRYSYVCTLDLFPSQSEWKNKIKYILHYKTSGAVAIFISLVIKISHYFPQTPTVFNTSCKASTCLRKKLAVVRLRDTLWGEIWNWHPPDFHTSDFKIHHVRYPMPNCFFSLSSYLTETTVFTIKTNKIECQKLRSSYVKCPLILSDFNQNRNM